MTPRETIRLGIEAIAAKHGIRARALTSGDSSRIVSKARREAILLVARETSLTLKQIGKMFARSSNIVFKIVGKGGTGRKRAQRYENLANLRRRVDARHYPQMGSLAALEFAGRNSTLTLTDNFGQNSPRNTPRFAPVEDVPGSVARVAEKYKRPCTDDLECLVP